MQTRNGNYRARAEHGPRAIVLNNGREKNGCKAKNRLLLYIKHAKLSEQ